ncbi:MAG: hypothetical protein QW071_03070 [Candidatus Bathyarchaeia archaeon]
MGEDGLRRIAILLPLAIAVFLRLYPTILSGYPFSTDAWPILGNTEILSKLTPVDLRDDTLFDGYNSYWPASTLYSVVLSRILGLDVFDTVRIGVPLSSALSIPIFYILVRIITGDWGLAFIASLILASSYPYSILTAGVTKETYANPIYILLILLYIYRFRNMYSRIVLFILSSIALALSHHLTSIVYLSIVSSIAISELYDYILWGYTSFEKLSYTIIYAIVLWLYFWLYAYRGLRVTVAIEDIASVASYQILALIPALYLSSRPIISSRRGVFALSLAAMAMVILAAYIPTARQVLEDLPKLPVYYMLYATPFMLASQMAILGFEYGRGYGWHRILALWISSILGLEAYSIFGGSSIGSILAYRLINFVWPPLSILVASGLCLAYRSMGGRGFRIVFARVMLAIYTAILLSSSIHDYYASIWLKERYMGYFWLYKGYEYRSIRYIASSIDSGLVLCDVKMGYLASMYMGLDVDVLRGLRYLLGLSKVKPGILVVYSDMLSVGYVLYGGCSVYLGETVYDRLGYLDLVYSNPEAWIYV